MLIHCVCEEMTAFISMYFFFFMYVVVIMCDNLNLFDSLVKVKERNSNGCFYCLGYSVPSLSGHSQQRTPSLVRPQIFAATPISVFTSHSHQRPPL